jgi:hypothetical protein
VFVTRGHLYLTLAKELGYDRIRAVIDKASPREIVSSFLENPSISQLDWDVVKLENIDDFLEYVWLVFFFANPLTSQEKIVFENQVVEFYRQIKIPDGAEEADERIKDLNYPYLGRCAEFQAYLPIEDERWYAKSKAVLVDFHKQYAPIVSFQGRRFYAEY